MIKRTLMAFGLGLALTGGTATAIYASSAGHATHAVVLSHNRAAQPGSVAKANNSDPSGACTVDATGNETGDCTDSQNTAGPEDTTAASGDTATGQDGDTVQAGDQSGPDTGSQSGQ